MNTLIFDKYIMGRLEDLCPGFGARKEKEFENIIHFIIYLRQILNGATAMLDCDNIADGLDFRYLEFFRYCNGHVGIMRHDQYGIVCFPGSFSDELDAYGRGKRYVGALLNGEPMDGEIGKDVVVIPNNYTYMPDFPLFYSFAKRLNEVDTSLDSNVFFTRMAPIIKVANAKIKAAVDEVLKDIKAGNTKCVVSDELENEIEGLKSIELFNITDVTEVDKLQYLSKYHDDLLRRLYTLGGHAMAGTQKMAQQSAYEVGQNDTIAMIYPMERLELLRIGMDEVNKLFGTDMSVRFSEAWQVEKEKIESSIASANQLQAGDMSTEEVKPEEPSEETETNETKTEEDKENEA